MTDFIHKARLGRTYALLSKKTKRPVGRPAPFSKRDNPPCVPEFRATRTPYALSKQDMVRQKQTDAV
ncbi:hypothetical protein [Aliiroseovarius sp. YM-037]|uniref:hypothetical protein n=1 Tax=Aliiroseovarius sp. YM-037 TaxID=3341728 RepID=UPI003A807BFF